MDQMHRTFINAIWLDTSKHRFFGSGSFWFCGSYLGIYQETQNKEIKSH